MKDVYCVKTIIGVTQSDCINIMLALATHHNLDLWERVNFAYDRTEVIREKLGIDYSSECIVYVELNECEVASLLHTIYTVYEDMMRAPKWLRIYNLLQDQTEHESNWHDYA